MDDNTHWHGEERGVDEFDVDIDIELDQQNQEVNATLLGIKIRPISNIITNVDTIEESSHPHNPNRYAPLSGVYVTGDASNEPERFNQTLLLRQSTIYFDGQLALPAVSQHNPQQLTSKYNTNSTEFYTGTSPKNTNITNEEIYIPTDTHSNDMLCAAANDCNRPEKSHIDVQGQAIARQDRFHRLSRTEHKNPTQGQQFSQPLDNGSATKSNEPLSTMDQNKLNNQSTTHDMSPKINNERENEELSSATIDQPEVNCNNSEVSFIITSQALILF